MSNVSLIAVILSALVFVGVIPVLEIGDSHLTNPAWPAHARLHEAWQLLSNAALSVCALVLVWTRWASRPGVVIALLINLSFLGAFALKSLYGGSMLHADGSQMAVGGVNVAVIVVVFVSIVLLFGYRTTRQAVSTS